MCNYQFCVSILLSSIPELVTPYSNNQQLKQAQYFATTGKFHENIALKIYNEFFIFNGIFPIYGIIENLKCQKKEEWKELLILARKNIDKNYKNFSIKEKSYVFYSEVRLKLYFLKPILKKLLRRK